MKETDRPNNGPKITSAIIQKLNTIQVSAYEAILLSLLGYLRGKTETFTVGSLAAYIHMWQELTSDPVLMQVSLTQERTLKVKEACENLLATVFPCIRDVAQVLGLMTSSFPGEMYGPLHHKFLEKDKTQALKIHKRNFDKNLLLSWEAIEDLKWWVSAIPTAYNPISHGDPQVTMTTDASFIGWGCSLEEVTSGGNWTPEEAQHEIDYLEMLASLS